MEQSSIKTPQPPYYTVVFSAQTTDQIDGYDALAMRMIELAQKQSGFLGVETAANADGSSLTVSYWADAESIVDWKNNLEHQVAQQVGVQRFYQRYNVRVGKIERDYVFEKEDS